MLAAHTAAAVYNSQRTKESQKVWSWMDLHPMHATKSKGASGMQIITTIAAMGEGVWEFAPGYSMETAFSRQD